MEKEMKREMKKEIQFLSILSFELLFYQMTDLILLGADGDMTYCHILQYNLNKSYYLPLKDTGASYRVGYERQRK